MTATKKANNKIYYVTSCHHGRKTVWEGTIDYLVRNVFGYTLECGNSWNHRINMNPTTLKSLLSNLEKSVHETQGSCFDPDSYWQASEFEITEAKTKNRFMNMHE